MLTVQEAKARLTDGLCDDTLSLLYGEAAAKQKKRILAAIDAFSLRFGEEREITVISAPGRTEIGGNHTDHNGGRVLAGSVDLDVIAVVTPEADFVARVHSEGFELDEIRLTELAAEPAEEGRSAALIRGVARGLVEKGYAIGGFSAYTQSSVPKGSGVSSSAAFEVLLGSIQNLLYNGGSIPPIELAKIGQFAEREYFGKPCGLMDQAACAMGGICMMDFADEKNPVVEPVPFSFATAGYKLCLVKLGGDHADLTYLYAAIPQRMKAVAALFGKEKLCQIGYEEILQALPEIRRQAGDDAALAALHFALETERVPKQKEALCRNDFKAFLALVNRSGHSSFEALQNVLIPMEGADQGAAVALNLACELLDGVGAWRIHGGGFGGTTQNFVPDGLVPLFRETMEKVFGEGACMVLSIRPVGPVAVL